MRTKDEILNDLQAHVDKLDPQHQELAKVAMIETEIQIDIRDELSYLAEALDTNTFDLVKKL